MQRATMYRSSFLCVSACAHCCAQVFDEKGNRLRTFGSAGVSPGQFRRALGIAVDSANNWIIAEELGCRIQILQSDGTPLTTFRLSDVDKPPGELFDQAECVCVTKDDRILVGDGTSRVHVFGFEL